MATFETTRPAPFGAVATFNVVTKLESIQQSLVKWNSRRNTRKALTKLSQRELADIGLMRADIDRM